jgi:hypothetical protein
MSTLFVQPYLEFKLEHNTGRRRPVKLTAPGNKEFQLRKTLKISFTIRKFRFQTALA